VQLHGGMVSLSQNPKYEASLQTQKDDQWNNTMYFKNWFTV